MYISIGKTKNKEFIYINQSFRTKNKTTTKIFKKLGTMEELLPLHNNDRNQVISWAKEQARLATEDYNKENEVVNLALHPNLLIKKGEQNSFNCGYLFLQSLCRDLRLDNICRNIRNHHDYEYNLLSILQDLIYTRILHPASKKNSYEFAHTLLEKPKYELHHIYRALSVLAQECDYIQSELYRNSHFIRNRNTKVLYYDCTNYFFEIEEADDLRRYGKSKENKPNPIVGMGLFMDADGVPLAFDIYPGNQNEQLTLKPLEEKVIRDFECAQFISCTDAGLASKKNKMMNHIGGRNFVVTQSLKKLKEKERDIALNPTQFRKVGGHKFVDISKLDESDPEVYETVYYKEIPLDDSKLDETLIITYSPKYKVYQRNIRQQQMERAKQLIEKGDKLKKERRNPHDPARFVKKTSITEHGEVADKDYYELDLDFIQKEEMYDGFYAVTTDLECDVAEIIKINKQRWQIEECFRIMKTDFEARPVYLQREDRIKSHFLICFLALLVYRLLENKLNKEYTVNEITNTLRTMEVTKVEEYGYIPSYKRTELTDKLHELFGFRTDTQIIKKSKMRSIIKQSKEK